MTMQFKQATKAQAKLRMAIDGAAGSGKTWTSLLLASALGSRVAVIDTERGSASKYADKYKFDVLELTTFSPLTYVEAIKAASAAGYDVLVIDSLSHAWMGKDGALEQKERAEAKMKNPNGWTAWREVTPLHNQLVDAILQAPLHIIVTMRSKMEYVQEKDNNGRTVIRKVGLAPIQRDGVEYEFDIVGDISVDHQMIISKTRCAVLDGASINKPNLELANTIKAWLTDGAPVTAELVITAPPVSVDERAATKQAERQPLEEWEKEVDETLGKQIATSHSPLNIAPLPPKVIVPSKQTEFAPTIAMPRELGMTLKSCKNHVYSIDKRKGAFGAANGFLDEYAGDTDRRHSFLLALFGVESSANLNDGQVAGLLAWKDAPTAKSETNRVIADYLKSKGQQELALETTPAT